MAFDVPIDAGQFDYIAGRRRMGRSNGQGPGAAAEAAAGRSGSARRGRAGGSVEQCEPPAAMIQLQLSTLAPANWPAVRIAATMPS